MLGVFREETKKTPLGFCFKLVCDLFLFICLFLFLLKPLITNSLIFSVLL